jgi:hypothetical protein
MNIDDLFPVIQETCEKVYHCKVVLTRYSPIDHSLVISQIVSLEPKKGNASKCMVYLIDTLERYGVRTIEIMAMPIPGTKGPGASRLMEWYSRFGFVVRNHTMVKGHLFSAEMELNLNLLPSKLVAMGSMDKNRLKSPIERSIHTTNDKGLPSKLVVDSLHGTRPPTIKEE